MNKEIYGWAAWCVAGCLACGTAARSNTYLVPMTYCKIDPSCALAAAACSSNIGFATCNAAAVAAGTTCATSGEGNNSKTCTGIPVFTSPNCTESSGAQYYCMLPYQCKCTVAFVGFNCNTKGAFGGSMPSFINRYCSQ